MSFVMAFLGTVVGVTVAAPSIAQAQDARIRVEQFAIVDGTGADRIRLATVPGISAAVRVLAPNGTTNRVVLATGQPSTGGTIPEAAGLDLFALDGTRIGRLGTGNSNLRCPDALRDQSVIIRVA
jgi:hypothetical protein